MVNPFLNLASPSAGAIVLFDGANLDRWVQRSRPRETAAWPITNGEMTTRGGDIVTRDTFRDFRLHVEFCCPDLPADVSGQKRSNSGVFLQGRYEIQVLDSWGKNPPGKGDCGAVYNVHAPLVNACAPGGEWQSYDVFFRAARFDATNRKTEPVRLTLLQNGVVVHNNVAVPRPTGGALDSDETGPGPLLLQDHGDAVRYRNIWLVPLPFAGSDRY
jgi:hypothetical protein